MKYSFLIGLFFIWKLSFGQILDFNTVDFSKADYMAKLNHGRSLDNLPLLAQRLTSNLTTDVEKFRAIYTWVCYNIRGDAAQDSKVSRKRKKFKNDSISYLDWNDSFKRKAFKQLLKNKKTMCTGYAYLIKELCFLANIECQIINGYARTAEANIEELDIANHSWNAVKLNNKWYLCDATWSSGYFIRDVFIKDFNEGYFLADPVLFSLSHRPLDNQWLLNDDLAQNPFVPSPIVYGETFKNQIVPVYPREFHISTKKGQEVTFSLHPLNPKFEDSISLVHFVGVEQRPFSIYDIKNEGEKISFKYTFKHKGTYDVHLKVGDDIVATHTVQVDNK